MSNKVVLIAALSKNGVIGKNNGLIFNDKQDLQLFKEHTEGQIVVMGRKTYESLPVRPLKNRENVVITSHPEANILTDKSGTVFANGSILSKKENLLNDEKDTYIIGGGQIYAKTIDFADELLISQFKEEASGDVYFPYIDPRVWICKYIKVYKNFEFKQYERIQTKKYAGESADVYAKTL